MEPVMALKAFLTALAILLGQWSGADKAQCNYELRDENAVIICALVSPKILKGNNIPDFPTRKF